MTAPAETPRMPLRTLLVDDEPLALEKLRALLADDRDIEVIGECANGVEALERVRRERPELVFLDIEMPEMDGLTMLDRIEPERMPAVVFVTAYDRYAVRAFEVHAVDYLLKPFDRERLTRTVEHVRDVLRRPSGALESRIRGLLEELRRAPTFERRLPVKDGGRVAFIDTEHIDWVQAAGNYVELHVGRERHLVRETLKRFEARLDPRRFVRVHRSMLVNLDRIQALDPGDHGEYRITLSDGRRLRAARGFSRALRTRMADRG